MREDLGPHAASAPTAGAMAARCTPMATRTRPALGADPRRVPGLRGAATWSGRGRRRPIAAGRRRGTPGRGEGAEVGAGGATEDARCTAVRRDRDACTVTRCTGPRIAAQDLPSEDRSFDTDEPMAGPVPAHPRLPARVRRRPRRLPPPAATVPAPSRCPLRGTAPTACSRRTGAGRGRTWKITCAVRRAPCGVGADPGSGRRPSGGWCAASPTTPAPAGGPRATAASPASTRQTSACASSWPARPFSPRRAAGPPATGPCPGGYRGGSHRAGRVTVPGRCSKVSMTSHSSSSGS